MGYSKREMYDDNVTESLKGSFEHIIDSIGEDKGREGLLHRCICKKATSARTAHPSDTR